MNNEQAKIAERTRSVRFLELVGDCLRKMGLDPSEVAQQTISPEEIAALISKYIATQNYNLDVALSAVRRLTKERDKKAQQDLFRRAGI